MACMEHACVRCPWVAFDNTRGLGACPRCGGDVRHYFDEPEHDDEPDDQEEEEAQDDDL